MSLGYAVFDVIAVSCCHGVTVRVWATSASSNPTPRPHTVSVTSIGMPEGDMQSTFNYTITRAIQEYANTHPGEVLTGEHNYYAA